MICVETMRRILAHPDRSVATPYIHALAPRVIEYLHKEESRRITSDDQLELTLESIETVDTLVSLAEPKNSEFRFYFKCILISYDEKGGILMIQAIIVLSLTKQHVLPFAFRFLF